MIYLSGFEFPTDEQEKRGLPRRSEMTCYNTFYPFGVLSARGLMRLELEPVTILYGSNGSGKTTALNIIAEKLRVYRDAPYNGSSFFGDYLDLCTFELLARPSDGGRFISSDDVFDFMLNLRRENDDIDVRREEVDRQYFIDRKSGYRLQSMDDLDTLKRVNLARSHTRSVYINSRLSKNIREHSNGESAFVYFREKIRENSIYLLDEPENSLSPERQQELIAFLEESVRFFGCQFIIATHSPFFLAMRGAKIYDMDESPVRTKRWTELKNVRAYYDLFAAHRAEFEE